MAYFLGRYSHGPEDNPPADHVRGDSPRHHANRNSGAEQRIDQHLARLGGDQLVRRHDGHVVTLPAHVKLKPGWVRLNPGELDTEREGTTVRERLHVEIDREAHEVRPGSRLTGRRIFIDGEGFHPERVDDKDVSKPTGAREIGKKP